MPIARASPMKTNHTRTRSVLAVVALETRTAHGTLYSNAIKADNNIREDPKNGQISLIESSMRAVKDIMSTKVRTQHPRSVFSLRSLVLSFDFLPTCTRFRAHTHSITDRRRFVGHWIIAMGIFWLLSESTEGRRQVLDAFPGLGTVSRCLAGWTPGAPSVFHLATGTVAPYV